MPGIRLCVVAFSLVGVCLWLHALYQAMDTGAFGGACERCYFFLVLTFFTSCGWQASSSNQDEAMVMLFCRTLVNTVFVLIGFSAIVTSQETCGVEHPTAYDAARRYILYMVFSQSLILMAGVAAVVIVMRGIRIAGLFGLQALAVDCEDTVRNKLMKLPFTPEALTDPHDGELEECSICMATFDASMEIVETPCHHHFHLECLAEWCKSHGMCPLCRSDVDQGQEAGMGEEAA